jgi:hypothetical protein
MFAYIIFLIKSLTMYTIRINTVKNGVAIQRSGHSMDQDLLELRKQLFTKECGQKKRDSAGKENSPPSNNESSEEPKDPSKEPEFDPAWYPVEWLTFIHYGPPCPENFDNSMWAGFTKMNGGPSSTDDANPKPKTTGRSARRNSSKVSKKARNASLKRELLSSMNESDTHR